MDHLGLIPWQRDAHGRKAVLAIGPLRVTALISPVRGGGWTWSVVVQGPGRTRTRVADQSPWFAAARIAAEAEVSRLLAAG